MTIKAEGSTKFTFEIVASGAEEARAKVEALQKALDSLKAATKTPINLDVKLSSGAQTLLKTNKNLITTALKAGGNLGTALKEGLEKSLSTDEKKTQNVITDTLLKENKESATTAVDDYIKEKERIQSSDQEKIGKQLTWAKDQTQKIQKEYDKFAEIKKKYDNGDDDLKAKLQDEVNTKARDLLGTIGNTFEERGTKIWDQLAEEKGQLQKIKEDLSGYLNEEYYKSSNYKGQKLSEIPTSELLWEEDKKAVEKAKQRLVEQREVGSEIIAAENDQLFTRAEAVDKQITQAKAIQKKISKAESSEEVKGLMSSLDGINWTPETEETVQAKNKSKRNANLLTQETDKATKTIDNFISESQSALDANKQKVEAEEKWAKSRLDDFKSVLEEAGITQEKLAFTKDGRLEEAFTEAESATLKDVIAQIDSLTSDDGTSEFDRVKAVKKEARTLRDSLVRAINYDEGDEVQGQDAYGQLLGDSIRDEVKTLTEKYRKENVSNDDKAKPSTSESILSEAEEARLNSQVALAQKAKTTLSKSKTVKEAKQAIQSLQQGMVETQELSSGSLNELADIYANDYDSLVATFNENKNDTQAFVKKMNEYSNMKLEDQKFKGKNNFDSARNILKNFENLPTSQYEEFGNLLKDLDLYSLPDGSENFSGEKVFQTVKDGLSNALKAYSKLSQEDINKYVTKNAEEFLANQQEFNKQPVDSKAQYSSVNTLNNSLNKVTKSLDSINNTEVKVDSVDTAQTKIDSLGSENKTISIEINPPLAETINQLDRLRASLESLPKKINIPLTLDSKKAETSLKNIEQKLQSNPQLVTDTASETKTTTKTKANGKTTETTTTTTTETTKKDTDQLTSTSTLEEVTSKLSDFKGKVTFETNLEELQSKVADLKGKINFTSNLDDLLSKVESVIGRSILSNSTGKSGETALQEIVAQKAFLQESSEQFSEVSKGFSPSMFASDKDTAKVVVNKAKEFLGRLRSYTTDEMAALNETYPELVENWEAQAKEATKIVNQNKITVKNKGHKGTISQKKLQSLKQAYEEASSEELMDRHLEADIQRRADTAKKVRHQATLAQQGEQETTEAEKLNTVVNNLDDKSRDIAINVDVSGIEEAKSSLESLNTSLDSLKQKASEPIKIDVSLSEDAKTTLAQQEALAKEATSKAKESTTSVAGKTSNLVQGLTEPTEQAISQEVETLKTNIQTKINKALSSYSSGDMNSFYQAMSEPFVEGAKPIGDYLLDAYTQIGQIKNGDLSSIISNLSVSDSEQLKNVSQAQLNQVRSVLKDMATAYSTAYTHGLENVDETTQKAVQSYQPKFNERYNQIFPKETTSSETKSATEGAKEVQTAKDYESVLNSVKDKASELNLKLNIEPSAEQVTSQIESLKSALDSLKSEDIKINFSTNIEEVLSQVEATRAKIQDSVKNQQTQSTAKEEASTTVKEDTAKTTKVVSTSEEPTQVKEVKTSKEVKVPVTGEVTNLETPKEQTVKVKAVTETTSDENKIAQKVTTTQGKVEFTSNIEDLQSRLSSMRGHVEFDSNISELQAQLNMVSKGSSGSKSTSSETSSSKSTETAKVVESQSSTKTVEPLKTTESKIDSTSKLHEVPKIVESIKDIKVPKETETTRAIENLKVAESTTTALAKLTSSPKALDAVQLAQSIKNPRTSPEVIELPTSMPTTALARLKESPKALDTAQFAKSLKLNQLPEVIELSTSVPFQKNQVKNTIQPALGMVEETFGNFREAAQTASNLTAASIQDSFKALSGQNFSKLENFTKTQAQLNNLENLLGTSSSFKLTSRSTALKIPNELLSQVPKYIAQTVPESSRYSINRLTSKLPTSTSGISDYVSSKNGNYSTSGSQLLYNSLSTDLINRYNSPSYAELSKIKTSLSKTTQQTMMDEVFSRINSKSHIPSKDYLNSLSEGLKQLDNLNGLYQQLGYSSNSSQAQTAQRKLLDTFNQNLKALDKQNELAGSNEKIASISAQQAKDQFGFSLNDTSENWKKSVENLLTTTLKESGHKIEKLSVSSLKDGKYRASYINGENDEATSFSFKPYTDASGQTSYSIQKTSSSVKPTTHVSSKYLEEFKKTATERFEELQNYYGDESNFLQSQELRQILDGRKSAYDDVVAYAEKQGTTQKQAEARLNRAIKEREKDFQIATKDLSREGYLGETSSTQFLDQLSKASGQQRKRFLEDTFKSLYEENGQSVKNLKVLSENGDEFTVQREVNGQKVTSKVKAKQYSREDGNGSSISFSESQSNGEFQTGSLKAWGSGVVEKFKMAGKYLAGMYMAQKVMSEISSGVSFIQETDKAMSNINMTMKATPQEITDLRRDAIQAGIDLKTSASNVIEATTIYANAGTDSKEILAKAKPTILLANASGQSASTAADQIQAVQNQFAGLENDSERIVNTYESISAGIKMDFATGIGSIADGVKNAGSIADEAGLGFEQFASIIAKVAEVTREEGSAIGNTLKTTMARISRSKTGDPEVTGKDRSLAAQAYKEVLGIDLFDNNGNYADLSETLDLLASRWNTLKDTEKNYIAEQSAGVRGINTFKVMMENYDEIQKLANNAMANPNYYKQVQETWANSLEGKKQEFEASKQQLWNNLLDSGAMKGIFDTGSFAVQLTSTISSGLKGVFDGVASTIVPTQAGKNGVSNLLTAGTTGSLLFSSWSFLKDFSKALNGKEVGGIKKAFTDNFSPLISAGKVLKDVGKSGLGLLSSLKPARNATKNFREATEAIRNLPGSALRDISNEPNTSFRRFLGSSLRENSWTKDLMADRDRIKAYNSAIRSGADEQTIAEARAALSQQSTALGKIGSWATQNSGLILAAGGAIATTALVNFITSQIEGIAQKRQEAFNTAQEKQQNYQQATQKFGEFQSFVEENKSQYDEYIQGVNRATNKNISLSDSDYQDYLRLTNQIAEYAPDLVSRYDSNGNAILNVKARDIEALTKALQDNERTVAQQGVDSFRDYLNAYKMANESQGMLDLSDTKYGTIQERQSFLDWIRNQDIETLNPAFYTGNFGSAEYEARLGSHPELREYLEKVSSISLNQLNEKNQDAFNKDITAEYNKNESELKEITNAFRPYLSSLADLERIDHGSQYKGIEEKDWDNFKAILSSTNDSKLANLLLQDPENGTAIDAYAQDWLQGLKVGGKDFAEAMDAVVTLNNRSSFKDLQFAFERYIPNLANGFPSGDENDIINSLQLEELQRTYQKGTEIIEKFARNKYSDPFGELQSRVKNQDILDQWRVENVPIDKEGNPDNEEFGKFIETNKNLSDNIKIKEKTDSSGTKEVIKAINSASTGLAFSKNSFDEDIRLSLANSAKEFSKEASAAIQGFFDKNEINTLDELNEVERFLDQLGKEGNIDLSRLQELWDRSDVSLAQNEEHLTSAALELDNIQKAIDAVNTAQANSRSINGLQKDDFTAVMSKFGSLSGFNYDKLFESTYNGVHLNVEEMEKLNNEYKKFQTGKYQGDIDDLTRKWQAKSREIAEAKEGSVEYNKAIEDRYQLESQIQRAQENLSRFEGMTNPVSEFLTSLKMTEEGANYDTLASSSGVGVVKDLYSKGLIGTDKFKKFAQMLTKEDLTGKGRDAYLEAYEKNIGNFQSLFTENYTGVANGLARLKNAGLMNDKDEIIGTVDEIANALSLTNSAGVTFMSKLREYGIETPFAEENDYMKNLRQSADKAKNSMSELGKSFDIDTRKTGLEDVQNELDKIAEAKEKINDTDLYPQKQSDLDYLNAIETYYKTLAGTIPKPLLDTRTEDGKIQASNRLNSFNSVNEQNGFAKLAENGFDWDSTNLDYYQAHLEDIGKRIKEQLSESPDGILKKGEAGYDETRALMEQMINQKQLLEEPVVMSYDTKTLKNADTKNAVEQTQNLVKALNNLQAKQEMSNLGLEIDVQEMTTAQESLQTIWDNIKKIDNGKIAAGLAEKGGFSFDIDFNDEKAVAKLESVLGEEHIVEILAELVGDDEVRKGIDELVDATYGDKVTKVSQKDGAFNRAMHEAYDQYNENTRDFDYGGMDRGAREVMAPSEIQVVAEFVKDQGSLAEITNPEKKEIILDYVRDSDALKELPEERQKIVLDYIQGDLPEEQIPEAEQIINRILGIDESQNPVEDKTQNVPRVVDDSATQIQPADIPQMVPRQVDDSATTVSPAPVYQDVIRRVTEVGVSSSMAEAVTAVAGAIGNAAANAGKGKADGTAHVSGTALAEGNAKPSLWQRIKDKGSAFAQGLKGKWGAKKTETALVGELGPELRVRPKTGQWDMLGGNGAQFAQIHKGDIIFNHICGLKIH